MRVGRYVLLMLVLVGHAGRAHAAPCDTSGAELIVDGETCSISGVHTFERVHVRNGGVIQVSPYDGGAKHLTGNLELRAKAIIVEVGSSITARGRGYQTPICGDGTGPTADAAGAGGCAVRDSGGGGAHFGRGGRGTKDIGGTQSFPRDYEEDCGNSVVYNGAGVPSCSSTSNCRNSDGEPSVAGSAFHHSIYEVEFGASGGDKGCRDGDGTTINTAGHGGGRIVLAGLDATQTGTVEIYGTVDANGRRGCGNGNDSAGGGAGGTVFIAGDNVQIGANASIRAAGGLGGDTQGLAFDPTGECVAPAQQGGTCDDCGGGGGGGIISVLSRNAVIANESVFDVSGALGGICPICRGEAGGGVGELQISGGYVGEFCDGYDNDFDDAIDEDLPMLNCAGVSMPSCLGGVPLQCPPDTPACVDPVSDTRARFAIIMDTSGSMLGSLSGVPTFGDGSADHPGLDQDGNGQTDDSRLYKAKQALAEVISAYPEIDFALARYHQDTSVARSCQMASWFECNQICCTYDNPTNNTGASACQVDGGALGMIPVGKASTGDECINYAGSCGPPRRGADMLVGFGQPLDRHLSWLDGQELGYRADTMVGNYCADGDCELRGTGPTPLANALAAVEDYLGPIKACDGAAEGGCRRYGVILLTDGAESCHGDPVAAAAALRARGIDTFVVGFSTLPNERTQLDTIAAAGGTGVATIVGDQEALANALAGIVGNSVVFETCNSLDDDCDGAIDETFPTKGMACADTGLGACRGTGAYVCSDDGTGTRCNITQPGAAPVPEACNGLDDDCNGAIDDGITCTPGCTPTSAIDNCNGLDDDCDGQFDEDEPMVGMACGASNVAPCQHGQYACIGGGLRCVGAIDPSPEACNQRDDNCDGVLDNAAACPDGSACLEGGCRLPCAEGEFPCAGGLTCVEEGGGRYCVPSACANCADDEICRDNACVDPCANVTCDAKETCRLGTCVDCNILGCPSGQLCRASTCTPDPCLNVDCASACSDPQGCSCIDGACVPNCLDIGCPNGERCGASGACEADLCLNQICSGDETCEGGACVPKYCGGLGCGPGETCARGTCVDDPCKFVACSNGFHCELREGAARCAINGGEARAERITTGRTGCQSSDGLTWWPWLVLLAGWRRRRSLMPAALLFGACNFTTYDLEAARRAAIGDANRGDAPLPIDAPGDNGGGPGCVPQGADTTCDEIDQDCDGIVDNGFDKTRDSANCGGCGVRCGGAGAVVRCVASACAFEGCQPGFADLDQDAKTCEYQCPVFPTLAEDCNGFDDDCDGMIDETLPTPPTGQCRTTPGTPCAGTAMTCATRGGVTRWYCNYGLGVEFDPLVPNGIVLAEQRCDGADGDCDGVADDTFTDLNQACDNGGLGICRDAGLRRCDPNDASQTYCDLGVAPDAQPAAAEQCDGLDNDCNGIVDDATGPGRVIDAMVHVVRGGLDYYIDAYEAARPDASPTDPGGLTHRACSTPNVQPWRSVSHATAEAACAAAGKTLCSSDQWQVACEGEPPLAYPYGNAFDATTCNTRAYDGIPGGTDDDIALATGRLAMCRTPDAIYDLSGNLKEWTSDQTGSSDGQPIYVLRGGAYDTPALGATCQFRTTRAPGNLVLASVGFRCCRTTAP